MADNDYASETSSERFPLRDFSETPRKDSTPTEPNSAAVEETKSFGPTYNDDAQNEAHHNETSGWGTNPSAASSSSAGYLACGTSSQESYGMSRRSAREPKNFHQWSGDQKRRVGGVVNKLGEKNSTIRGLMDFEFKNFMTISHVQVLYKKRHDSRWHLVDSGDRAVVPRVHLSWNRRHFWRRNFDDVGFYRRVSRRCVSSDIGLLQLFGAQASKP